MALTKEGADFLERLHENYSRVAFWSGNYRAYIQCGQLPRAGVVTQTLYLPADSWNSGHDYRIRIPKGAGVVVVLTEDCYSRYGVGGTDADRLKGLWASDYSYGYGQGTEFKLAF